MKNYHIRILAKFFLAFLFLIGMSACSAHNESPRGSIENAGMVLIPDWMVGKTAVVMFYYPDLRHIDNDADLHEKLAQATGKDKDVVFPLAWAWATQVLEMPRSIKVPAGVRVQLIHTPDGKTTSSYDPDSKKNSRILSSTEIQNLLFIGFPY